ncbi:uncharacterized protein BO96DRAFT_428300 [Aspergillus niger CBS 101883]|uniref:Contig An12c0200, genomic contig n=2 Tax=Aspergillus niger TaxID=5061 RepID=A2R002_ASPNC|nr:uncharacterized protein BO96DRAFT_428300 [Aspergillus niger CBS 101883]XP_059601884.1 uncharacterized protein An12g06850 [Aspergillus niger]PYH50296.1 hypothetical protein BO96DRAFT_428300 [Aspergillus niger CBS 101883]CAK41214.1 unnamed protein product [Aspergillus niger]
MHWFIAAVQECKAAAQEHLHFLRSLSCVGFGNIDSDGDLTSIRPVSSSSSIIDLPTPPSNHGLGLRPIVIAGKLFHNAIFGTYEPKTRTVVLNEPALSCPFKDIVYLDNCDFKVLAESSNGNMIVTFTHVNINAWRVIASVPYHVAQSRPKQPFRPSLASLEQQHSPAPPPPVRLMPHTQSGSNQF